MQRNPREKEIPELAVKVQIHRIENDVIMDMGPIRMRRYEESMVPFGKTHGGFIADAVCFFRCDFPMLEGLPNLINDDIALIAVIVFQIF